MDKFKIVVATSSDAEPILQVQHDTWIATYPNDALGITVEEIKERVSKNFTPERIADLKKSLSDLNQSTWVSKIDTKVIGYCTATKGESINKLMAIYVLPQYHGKNIGAALVEHALEYLGTDKTIEVEVASYNKRAINFYKKYGFVENGKSGNSGSIPTVFLTKDPSSK